MHFANDQPRGSHHVGRHCKFGEISSHVVLQQQFGRHQVILFTMKINRKIEMNIEVQNSMQLTAVFSSGVSLSGKQIPDNETLNMLVYIA